MTRACVSALTHWRNPFWLKRGVTLDTAHKRKVVMTDASNKGWGALCEGKLIFGLWAEVESTLHINCLEMLAVCQACHTGTPCASTLRHQVRGVIHKSPWRPRLEATLHVGERPSWVGPEQSALAEGEACAICMFNKMYIIVLMNTQNQIHQNSLYNIYTHKKVKTNPVVLTLSDMASDRQKSSVWLVTQRMYYITHTSYSFILLLYLLLSGNSTIVTLLFLHVPQKL